MEMPKVGDNIRAFGYPSSSVEILNRTGSFSFEWNLSPVLSCGEIAEVHDEYRDGQMSFPCFESNARFDGGMSGGLVLNHEDKACGVISKGMELGGGTGNYISWTALLPAAMFTQLTFQTDEVALENPCLAFDLIESGFLRSPAGWNEMKDRIQDRILGLIEEGTDEDGKPIIRFKHAPEPRPRILG